ncbi:hypothetical protein TWF217_005232 [Orbilia oligospora]|nr:hypothetical protein TWF217_005232 [Orbilia oligospora]
MQRSMIGLLSLALSYSVSSVIAISCPPSITLTATQRLFCPLIRCETPTTPCTPTTTTISVPCVCQTKPPITTSLKPSCPTNGCACPTEIVTKSAHYCPTTTPPTTMAPCTACPFSKTVSTGFPVCNDLRCASPPIACPQIIRLVDIPCCCQGLPPTISTVKAQCPPNGCTCVIPTVTSTEECSVPTK